MTRVRLEVTPQQAADLVSGIARAIVVGSDVPAEALEPQVLSISCPEIGWSATAYAYDVVQAEPRYLLALDISRRVEAKKLGTTRLRLMHLANMALKGENKKVTVFCMRRVGDELEG